MSPEQRAVLAQQYLDSPVFRDYLDAMTQDIINQIAECPIRDNEGRLLLQFHLKFIRGIEASLRGYAQTGRFESQPVPMIKRFARKLGA